MKNFIIKHKRGITGTILFHMFLLILFLIFQLKTQREHINSTLLFDFEEIDMLEEIRKQKEEEIKELIAQTELSEDELERISNDQQSNQAVNESMDELNKQLSDDRNESTDDLYKMAKDLQDQLNKTDEEYKDLDEFGAMDEEKKDTIKKQTTFYKGPTNITYDLKDRVLLKLEVPVYKCQGGGKVFVNIEVNRNGYVIKATADAKKSVLDECFLKAAIDAALITRFNISSSAPEKQKGTITYNFVAQ